ncbi:hypothetical protein BRADI_2g53422v3 [Brachypodium distachyon]|uniref:MINDY deubiquitinase domain-containing protein n=1 Tax=Brachypodium distachyon TaxID=15368 RepID=A0A0Q3IX99_BRADI|nr:hypothetical protein BRADI_2g53422v3 [Brachypodium distachyon]
MGQNSPNGPKQHALGLRAFLPTGQTGNHASPSRPRAPQPPHPDPSAADIPTLGHNRGLPHPPPHQSTPPEATTQQGREGRGRKTNLGASPKFEDRGSSREAVGLALRMASSSLPPVQNLGGSTYILCVPKQGDLPFAYMCNALILINVLKLENEEVQQGTVSKDLLLEKCVEIFANNPHPSVMVTREAIPTYLMKCFKTDRNVKLKRAIKNKGCFDLLQTLKKKKKSRGKDLDENGTLIDQFLSHHSPYSVSCLIKRISEVLEERSKHASVFYWGRKFSTITVHSGTLYVLDAAASCLLKQVVWQRLTVDPSKDIFFDSHFREMEQNKVEILKLHLRDGPACVAIPLSSGLKWRRWSGGSPRSGTPTRGR